jgi:SAM-dependent methyltransferase
MRKSADSAKLGSTDQDVDSLWKSYHNDILILEPLAHIRHSLAGRVLDVGSGEGESLWLIGRFGVPSVGLDVNPSGKSSIKGTAIELPFKAGSFGVVMCLRTLQHIREDKIALREMRRVLRPGGYIIVSVANKRSFTMTALKSKGEWRGRERIPYEWFKPYTEQEVESLLRVEGFEIVESDVVGFAPEILHRRYPTLSKFTLRVIMEMDKALRALPLLGPRGSHVRVIARLAPPISPVSLGEP